MRLNISMSDSLIKVLDEHAKDLNLSRSAYISMAVSQKIQGDDLAKTMPDLLRSMNEFKNDLNAKFKSDNQIKIDV